MLARIGRNVTEDVVLPPEPLLTPMASDSDKRAMVIRPPRPTRLGVGKDKSVAQSLVTRHAAAANHIMPT
jgi:hypothetical protein